MRSPVPQTSDARTSRADRGFSLIELLIVVAIILIISAIAIPNLLHSKMAANEAAAVANLRTITSMSVVYDQTYSNGYPPDLPTLGGPPTGTPNCGSAQMLDTVLSSAPFQKSGYQFGYTGTQGNVISPSGCSTPGFNGFLATAAPLAEDVTGIRSFCSTEPGEINVDNTGNTPASEAACQALVPLSSD
jgi:type IV pilus assembly protein PilA